MTGKVIVVAAPSGAGKTSLVRALVTNRDDIEVAVSHTTRDKRPKEVDGQNYHFVSRDQFLDLKANDGFLETAEVFGNLYGTSRAAAEAITSRGKHLVLEIDWQGAEQIRVAMPEALSIFILPPSLKTLRERLEARAQDDADTIAHRTAKALDEMSHFEDFDYLIVNDDFDQALQDMELIADGKAPHLSRDEQKKHLATLLAELLGKDS